MSYLVNLILLVFFIWSLTLGNTVCRKIFEMSGLAKKPKRDENGKEIVQSTDEKAFDIKTGRVIGICERVLYSLGVFLHNWEIIVGVVTFKSVARYKELDEKIDAEYFLVGSLISLLWSIAVCGLVLLIEDFLYYEDYVDFRLFNKLYKLYKN